MIRTVAVALWAIANLVTGYGSSNSSNPFTYCNSDLVCSETDLCYRNPLGFCTFTSSEAAAANSSSDLLICTESSTCGPTQQCSFTDVGFCISDALATVIDEGIKAVKFCLDSTMCNENEECTSFNMRWCLPNGEQWIDPASIDSILSCYVDGDCPWTNQTCHTYHLGVCIPDFIDFHMCATDTDCTSPKQCLNGICICPLGSTSENNDCSSVEMNITNTQSWPPWNMNGTSTQPWTAWHMNGTSTQSWMPWNITGTSSQPWTDGQMNDTSSQPGTPLNINGTSTRPWTNWQMNGTRTEPWTPWNMNGTNTQPWTALQTNSTSTVTPPWSLNETTTNSQPRKCNSNADCISPKEECREEICTCSTGFVSIKGTCRQECLVEARQLHDMLRRIDTYKTAFGEPVVTDHKIAEQWYSLGQYRLAGATPDLKPGSCGSPFPIVLSDSLVVDWEALDMNEVSLMTKVFGRPAKYSEELEIRVRKCEDDIQYYLKPPKIRLAAYCFESLSKNLSNSNGTEEQPAVEAFDDYYYLSIAANLHFNEKYIDKVLYDVPYVVWTCNLQSYMDRLQGFPEISFISLSWFANNDRILWTGRWRITDVENEIRTTGVWTASQLFEDDLRSAGYTLGILLRCGVQISLSETGKLSQMTTTLFDTNLFQAYGQAHYDVGYLTLNDHNNLLSHYNTVPLGCSAPQGTLDETCNLKLVAVNDEGGSLCSSRNIDMDEVHELCGLTVVGLTKYGLEMHSNEYQPWQLYYGNYNENNTSIYERFGTHMKLESSSGELENGAGVYFSMAVVNNTAGHHLWDNYIARNVEVPISDEKIQDSEWHYCRISREHMDNQTKLVIKRGGYGHWSYIYEDIPFQDPGKYIMLWSGTFPFNMEIEVESNPNGLYVCGGTLRYGNDIYTYSMCGGIFLEGLIAGDGTFLPETITGSVRIKEISLQMYFRINDGHLSIEVSRNTDLADGLEGFCAFGRNAMVARDGNRYNETTDFLRSWSIEHEESLGNLANQDQLAIQSKFYECGCPTKTDDVPNRVVVSESEGYRNEHVYTGVFHCNLDEFCTVTTAGNEWKTTLLPVYLIEQVRVEIEQNTGTDGEPLLLFTCQFNSVPGYFYKIQWLIDDFLFKELGPTEAVNRNKFTITDDEIYEKFGSNFLLDMKIQCSVSVFDNAMNELILPILSEDFYPIKVTSDHISIQRGGDSVVSLISNIPFKCTGSNTICDMEIKFFDPNDSYDCENSTLAIKSADSCGGIVTATSTAPARTGTETTTIITTKNNDKYDLRKYFELHVVIVFHGAGKMYWTGRLRTVIDVVIQDEVYWFRQSCHLHVDPHSRSMDGLYYENQNVDLFVLLRHKTLPIEIQTLTTPCWSGWGDWSPTCSCALIIRAGADVYLINHCDNKHFTGFLSAGDKLIQVYERYDTRYQIFLPNTMMIDVYVMPYFNYVMNIDIYPSPMEKNNIEGLCGNFNGKQNDDMKLRDSLEQGNNDEFSLSWGLLGTNRWSESLLNKSNYENPSPWNINEKLCICPDAAAPYNEPICSVNEEKTCTKSKNHKGRKLNTETRHKRDAEYIDLDVERRLNRLRSFIFNQHANHRRRRSTGINVYNESYARALCEEAFNACPVMNISGKPVQEDTYLDDCTKDVAATGNTEWALPHCDALTTRIENEIVKDVVYAQNNSEVVEKMEKVCFANCNGHGECINGTCQCDSGWDPPYCLLDSSKVVKVTFITGDGLCDSTERSCEDVVVETSGLVAEPKSKVSVLQRTDCNLNINYTSESLSKLLMPKRNPLNVTQTDYSFLNYVSRDAQKYGKHTGPYNLAMEAGTDGKFKHVEDFTRPASRLSFNEAVVSLSGGRRRRSTGESPVLASQFGVSISNDGVNFGNLTYVMVLDSRCQEAINDSNGESVVLLKFGFCYIDGICYSEGEVSVASSCKLCRAAADLFDWTEENCSTDNSHADTGLPTFLIVIAACGGLVLIILVSGLIFLRFASSKRPVSPMPTSPIVYDRPSPEGPMNLRFYLSHMTDAEMGAEKGKDRI